MYNKLYPIFTENEKNISTGDKKMKKLTIWALIGALVLVISCVTVLAVDDASRIFIGDDEESDHTGDAVITAEEAKSRAEEHTGGTALSVELENEDGYLVYGVIIETDSGRYDVKVDAGNGSVLKVEDD